MCLLETKQPRCRAERLPGPVSPATPSSLPQQLRAAWHVHSARSLEGTAVSHLLRVQEYVVNPRIQTIISKGNHETFPQLELKPPVCSS